MIVLEKQKVVLISTETPNRYTTLFPHARTTTRGDKTIIAVPHRVEETNVLRNIGVDIPTPFATYFKWPRKPFVAQEATAEFLTINQRAFVLNSLGTGKTLAALAAYDYLREQGLAKRLLVVCPLSTMDITWAEEIFTYFPHLSTITLHGTHKQRVDLLNEDADVYIINHDGLKVGDLSQRLGARLDINTIIVDEIASFRNASTDRWKSLRDIVLGSRKAGTNYSWKRVWGLTGTPTPTDPTNAWAQAKLIRPDNVPKFYSHFRDKTMRQLSTYKWTPRDEATDIVDAALQPSIRFTREQCIDLPPVLYQRRKVQLSGQQQQAYMKMAKDLQVMASSGPITAVNEGVKLNKMLQISCGMAYDDNGQTVNLHPKDRIAEVVRVYLQAPSKVIVFAPFRAALDLLEPYLSKIANVGRIDGSVGKTARDKIFRSFRSDSDDSVELLLAQPSAMSHGLTLTSAATIVWYAPPNSYETFEQANGRITRPGQKLDQLIVMLSGSPVEDGAYKRLESKKKMQGMLLDLVNSRSL